MGFDEQEYTRSFDIRSWKKLLPFLRPYRGLVAVVLVVGWLAGAATGAEAVDSEGEASDWGAGVVMALGAETVPLAAEAWVQPASSRAASVRIRSCFFICLSSYTFFVFCDTETAIARFHPKTARRQNLRAEVANQPFSVSIAALVCATYRA